MGQLVLEYAKLFWSPQVTIAAIVAGLILFFLMKYRTQIAQRITTGGLSVKGPGGFAVELAAQRQASNEAPQAPRFWPPRAACRLASPASGSP